MDTKKVIDRFKGEYHFLSNFHESEVLWEGDRYPTSEHAYQSSKTVIQAERMFIKNCLTPGNAKKNGRDPKRITMRKDFDKMKLNLMYKILTIKFMHYDMRQLLLATGDAELIEGNNHGDKFWGTVDGEGKNHLGKILMIIRDEIKQEIKEIEDKENG